MDHDVKSNGLPLLLTPATGEEKRNNKLKKVGYIATC
jgi:hypothetical protein